MLIDEKKDAHRGSYKHFLKVRQPIDLGKIKAPLSREFYQASCGIEGILRKEDYSGRDPSFSLS